MSVITNTQAATISHNLDQDLGCNCKKIAKIIGIIFLSIITLPVSLCYWSYKAYKISTHKVLPLPHSPPIPSPAIADTSTSEAMEIHISQEAITIIEEHFEDLDLFNPDKRFISQVFINNNIFKLSTDPGVFFKTPHARRKNGSECVRTLDARNKEVQKRFANMQKAKLVCREHNLNCLVVPAAKIIAVKDRLFIAEQAFSLEGPPNWKDDELVRQLSIFIAYTGWSDVGNQNLCVSGGRVVLFDVEDMDYPQGGLQLLHRHVSLADGNAGIVKSIAEKHRIRYTTL